MPRGSVAAFAGAVGTVALAVACALPQPGGERPPLGIQNGTTLEVRLFLNDQLVGVYGPGSRVDPIPLQLPPVPWHVEARTVSGRVLVSMDVARGTVRLDGTTIRGAGARVDLSCGRLDIWSGPPMAGPMPGAGVEGDCQP